MKLFFYTVLIFCLCDTARAQFSATAANNPLITYHGRTLVKKSAEVELISSASYAEFEFEGDSCIVALTNTATPGDYNYAAIELDNEYKGRIRVANNYPTNFTIVATKKIKWHLLRIYKATEALTGLIGVRYIKAFQVRSSPKLYKKKIEFIGNSITSGFGDDDKEIPCGNGSKWYDQHNAYWSYAARVARSLDANFMLSTISGTGIYRNWNSDGPTVPQQYESAYLRIDSAERWNFRTFIPDVVVIALGTNDLSGGDGKTPRKDFDSTIFVDTYIGFLKTIYAHYPSTQIVLLTSAMLNGYNAKKLLSCLQAIKNSISKHSISPNEIKIFEFRPMNATGCAGHPSLKEHETLASELLPFMRAVLKELH